MSDKKLEKWLQDNHPEYFKIVKTMREISRQHAAYYNEHISDLLREEHPLREKLPTLTTKEKVEVEKRIDEIEATIKNDQEYQRLEKEREEAKKDYEDYINNNFSYKEKVEYLGLSPHDGFNYFTREEKEQYWEDENKAENAFCRKILLGGLLVIIVLMVAAALGGQI